MGHRPGRSGLLVCEDVNRILNLRARDCDPSQERLLNVTDGILGQLRGVVVLVTTNADPCEFDGISDPARTLPLRHRILRGQITRP